MFQSKMKKVQEFKGFIIANNIVNEWGVFTKDEWAYGEGLRNAEFECGSLQECKDNINSY